MTYIKGCLRTPLPCEYGNLDLALSQRVAFCRAAQLQHQNATKIYVPRPLERKSTPELPTFGKPWCWGNHRWLSATFSLQNDLFLESTWKLVCNMSSSHDISFSDFMTCSRTKSQLKQKCLSCQVMPSERWRKSVNSTNVISLANDIISCGNISYHIVSCLLFIISLLKKTKAVSDYISIMCRLHLTSYPLTMRSSHWDIWSSVFFPFVLQLFRGPLPLEQGTAWSHYVHQEHGMVLGLVEIRFFETKPTKISD